MEERPIHSLRPVKATPCCNSVLERHLAVDLFGTYGVTQAFLPQLARSPCAIVNNLFVAAFAPLPIVPAYSISKAAAFSLTQAQRALLAHEGVRVHAVFTGPTDTDMCREFDAPKASPESVARAIFDASRTRRKASTKASSPALMRTSPRRPVPERLRPTVRFMIESLGDAPALVLGRRVDVLAWNRMAHPPVGPRP
ncbi:SDR family NAD(P)-dependent oxidoreductase [Microbispora catharanthi]|uniref:SDR family NAD(P)-dependent oxidoreductase n=1 Tax=Microbispora catharanthi TaxID=1712871 RepID=UPI00197B23A0|nr:SDR family NAD(P)-dependent oxidoreductase [Microbispora catharanthi]